MSFTTQLKNARMLIAKMQDERKVLKDRVAELETEVSTLKDQVPDLRHIHNEIVEVIGRFNYHKDHSKPSDVYTDTDLWVAKYQSTGPFAPGSNVLTSNLFKAEVDMVVSQLMHSIQLDRSKF